jgi:hypothetical protein
MRSTAEAPRTEAQLRAVWRAHDAASARRQSSYVDPVDGDLVMTAHYLRARGYCCGAGCRHCPYPAAEQAAAERPADAECLGAGPGPS